MSSLYFNPEKHDNKPYIPNVRALGIIEFHDVERFNPRTASSKEALIEKISLACEEAKRSYERIRDQRSLLTESFAAFDQMQKAWSKANSSTRLQPVRRTLP